MVLAANALSTKNREKDRELRRGRRPLWFVFVLTGRRCGNCRARHIPSDCDPSTSSLDASRISRWGRRYGDIPSNRCDILAAGTALVPFIEE